MLKMYCISVYYFDVYRGILILKKYHNIAQETGHLGCILLVPGSLPHTSCWHRSKLKVHPFDVSKFKSLKQQEIDLQGLMIHKIGWTLQVILLLLGWSRFVKLQKMQVITSVNLLFLFSLVQCVQRDLYCEVSLLFRFCAFGIFSLVMSWLFAGVHLGVAVVSSRFIF